MAFLPITKEEMIEYGWEQPDFVFISGDAYVDHPSFGVAIISRIIEAAGYKVAIISQPLRDSDYCVFGPPRLAFLVSSGNIDSMVNHYTVARKKRKKDFYTPNGEMGKRPDRAATVYTKKVKMLFPNSKVILGGIEASLRRLSHYDYWSDQVRPSLLLESGADMLVYGMGEKAIVEIADALHSGLRIEDIIYVKNTVFFKKELTNLAYPHQLLPSHEEIKKDKKAYVMHFKMQMEATDFTFAHALAEKNEGGWVIQNPVAEPLQQTEMDQIYALPYERAVHPLLEAKGHVPAIDEVKFSIIANRGCYGGCRFCALTMHQGRIIQSRSQASIVEEAKTITKMKDFKGFIHDIGGPTANFYHPACDRQIKAGACRDRDCIGFTPCKRLKVSHQAYLEILRAVRALPKVKKVFIRSGIRYDYLMYDRDPAFLRELVEHHISGQLKVAPEHIDDEVLRLMGKPSQKLYDRFVRAYEAENKKLGKKQFLVPYFISSHPGSTLSSAVKLALYLKESGYRPEQVQDFYPTPGTASTCMYYTGIDPYTMEKVEVVKNPHEKAMQRALLQYFLPQNKELVKEALVKANRRDLIGYGQHCLITPTPFKKMYRKT